jgi:hypothetical protein
MTKYKVNSKERGINRKRHGSIYKNRANVHVLNRMLEFGEGKLKIWCEKDTNNLLEAKDSLLEELKTIPNNTISTMTEQNTIKRKLSNIMKSLDAVEYNTKKKEWLYHTKQLMLNTTGSNNMNENISRLVIANRMLKRDTEIFYNDQNSCSRCENLFTFDHITNLNVCNSCGLSNRVLFVLEDKSQDLLVGKDPVSINTNIKNTNVLNNEPSLKVTTSSIYHRSPLYKRFLQQFSVTAPPIPMDIMKTLYQYLSNIHLQNSVRCRPTPVASILRASGYSKWANSSIVISKMFNGEPIPKLSNDLIDRLVHRFIIIFRVANIQNATKQKIPSFEFLTHILLYIEGEFRLATSFKTHKTRSILLKTFNQFKCLLEVIKQSPQNDMEWKNLPNF